MAPKMPNKEHAVVNNRESPFTKWEASWATTADSSGRSKRERIPSVTPMAQRPFPSATEKALHPVEGITTGRMDRIPVAASASSTKFRKSRW